ncbi:MAG: hypothetical protein EBU80_14120, partial [Chitinophagia bacterium]|nr:hypothetical protein [Chitinophagia bacterium]
VNDIYDRDVKFTKTLISSNLITSNLSVIGETTILNTNVYQTEQLEIINDASATSMKVSQTSSLFNVAEFYNSNNLTLVIDKNANIGIGGINEPSSLLHLHKNNNDNIQITLSDINSSNAVILKKDINQDFIIKNNDLNGDIIIGVNGKDKTLIITPEGNIGIGTTQPLGVFDIRGGNFIISENNYNIGIGITNPQSQLHLHKLNSDDVVIKLTDDNSDGVILKKDSNQDFIIKNNDINGDIIIGVNGKDKTLIITPEGNIGIGTTQPLGVFDIRGSNLIIPETYSKVGIGLTNPQYQLDIIGTVNTTSVIASNITTSNLSVIGDTTILNTTVYQTEQL